MYINVHYMASCYKKTSVIQQFAPARDVVFQEGRRVTTDGDVRALGDDLLRAVELLAQPHGTSRARRVSTYTCASLK